jgi:hypothetical protein
MLGDGDKNLGALAYTLLVRKGGFLLEPVAKPG